MAQSPTTQTPLAELATAHASASKIFQRLGLDFCCQGRRSLDVACHEVGLDPADVLREIVRSGSEARPLTNASKDELIAHVVGHYHRRLREELPQVVAMANKVERVHASKPGCPLGLGAHLSRMEVELLEHMAKEENVLFPLALGDHPRLHAPVHVMEAEHRDHAAHLLRLRELTRNFEPPRGACATWRALYLRLIELERELMEHVHLENHVLFPRILGGN